MPRRDKGASVVLFWHYIDGLRRAGFEVRVVLLVASDESPTEIERFREDMGGSVDVLRVSPGGPVQRSRLNVKVDTSLSDRVRSVVAARKPDVTVCFDVVAAWTAGRVGPQVVWLGDLNFQTEWHHGLYAVRERPVEAIRLPFVMARCLRWRDIYRRVLRPADRVVVANASSVEILARLGIRAEYQPYPWPVPEFLPVEARVLPRDPTFAFMGTLQALGSRSAFHFLFRALHPRLVERWGPRGFRVVISGLGDPPSWVRAELGSRPELEFVGYVPDLRAFFSSVHATIAPIDVPVGNRSRIVTAMGTGSLVVAHRNASLGNPDLVDGRTCLLASDADEFAEKMQLAAEDEGLAAGIIQRARRTYEATFKPETAVARLVDTIRLALAAGRRGGSS